MNKLTQNFGKRMLRKRAKALIRDKSVQNFETANSAVIVFDVQMSESFNAIKEFGKYLESKKIKTSVIGFSSEKEPPEKLLLWPNVDIITKKDINWHGKPKNDAAIEFFNKVPDILFVLCTETLLPIEYLVQLSKAKFKVGFFTEEENDYDLMINPVDNKEDAGYFIEQIKIYINMLNPSNQK
ncbi:MAG TPA: hypothetical protein VJ951_02660 [Bacteroidales bacterium]|nr:hypothetical protein [Bacteroidales bacterium]